MRFLVVHRLLTLPISQHKVYSGFITHILTHAATRDVNSIENDPGFYNLLARTPPKTKLLPLEKDYPLLPQGSICLDDQLRHPLHANLLLQHETGGIHTTYY